MSKRNRKPAASTAGGRRSSVPIKVDKPKPWGSIVVGLLLAVALIGIIGYAAANQGAGYEDPLEKADAAFGDSLVVTPADEVEAGHVEGLVDYPTDEPPASGDHSASAAPCQVYSEPAAPEGLLHSLEHGGVWITYRSDLPADQVTALTEEYGGRPNVAISPFEGQTAPVSLQAWARQLTVESPDDDRIDQFLNAYIQGLQAPERTTGC